MEITSTASKASLRFLRSDAAAGDHRGAVVYPAELKAGGALPFMKLWLRICGCAAAAVRGGHVDCRRSVTVVLAQ